MDAVEQMDLNSCNAALDLLKPMIVATPEIGVGDTVSANGLGLKTGCYQAGERFVVVRVGELVGKMCGDYRKTLELWSIGSDGELKQSVSDPKFMMVVEKAAAPKRVVSVIGKRK